MKISKPSFKIPPQLFDAVYNLPAWQKALIMIASWVIPLGLFWFFFLSSSLGEMSTISDRIPKLKKEIRQLEAKKKRLPLMENDLKAMEEILKQALRLLPEKEDIPSVLTEISSLGNESGLDMNSFTPGREQIQGFYAAIPVSLSFSGPFHNTLVFFDKVGKMARIVHIRNIKMGQAKESKNIWSQKGSVAGAKIPGGANAAVASSSGTDDSSVERGSSWVIRTTCQAVTYRFLTPEEQKARNKKNKKKRRRRR